MDDRDSRNPRDPHFAAFAEAAADALGEALRDLEIPAPDLAEPALVALLAQLIPRPVLRGALEIGEA
jgi:hypothetical protein